MTILTNIKSMCPLPPGARVRDHCRVAVVALLKLESRGVLHNHIPYVGKLDLAQVLIDGWIIDSYEYGFLDYPSNAVCLPTHNGKTVHIDAVSRRLSTLVYGEEALRCF